MSAQVSVSKRTGVEHRQKHDDVDLIDDDVTKEWNVIRGNTVKLASMFGDVAVGAKRRSSRNYEESTLQVVKESDSSDSSSIDEDRQTKITKITTSTKASHQGRDSSSDEDQKSKVTKITKVTTSTKASHQGRDSSSDEDQKSKVTKIAKVTVAKVERREDRSSSESSDSENEAKTERKSLGVVKRKSQEVVHEAWKERRHEKVSKKTERNDSSEERKITVTKKETRQEKSKDKKGTREVTLVKKTVTEVSKRDSSSSDDEQEKTPVRKTNVTAAVKAFNRIEDDHREERLRERQKEKVKVVERKSRDSSSDSVREVKVTTRQAEVERSSSDTESEEDTKRAKKIQKQEANKLAVRARDHSDSDSESEKRVNVSKVEKIKKGIAEKEQAKLKEERQISSRHSSSSSSSSSDEESTEKRETKVLKVAKVSKSSESSSSDDETTAKKVDVKKRKVLIVGAHASKESYEGALYRAALKLFKARGDYVQTSNLYEMAFNPVASPQDFGGYTKEKGVYNYSLLAGQAKTERRLAQDIVAEQEKVLWADFILILSPIQNHGLPAILKGWFDRVMIYNFAYSEERFYEKGLLRDKKVLLCLTSAGLSSMYTPSGIHGDLNVYLWPVVNGILRFAGFEVLKPQIYFGVGRASADYKDKAIEALLGRLRTIWNEKPIAFIGTERFRKKRGFALSSRSLNDLAKDGKLTVAQYTGSQLTAMTVTFEPSVEVGNPWQV